jgi:hypothetical protein
LHWGLHGWLTVAAAAIKKNRQEIEERHRRREEERKKEEEERRIAEEQKRKAELVADLIGNWEEAVRLRKFMKAIEEETVRSGFSAEARNDIRQVVEWVRQCRHTGPAVEPSRGHRRVRSPREQVLVAGVSISTFAS